MSNKPKWKLKGTDSELSPAELEKYLEDKWAGKPATTRDTFSTKFVTVLAADGRRYVHQEQLRQFGEPVFFYNPDHPNDTLWYYDKDLDALPKSISLGEFKALGGPQNHRYYPAPNVDLSKAKVAKPKPKK